MAETIALTRLAVLGSPIKHSLSPAIHQYFAQQAGLVLRYDAIEVDDDHLSREVQRLADEGALGCNITSPHKQQAFALANRASERATIAQAANTLIFESGSRWKAENTDGTGLINDLVENLGLTLKGRTICLLGSGGAAAGVLYDLLAQQPSRIMICNRSPGRAEALALRFRAFGTVETCTLESLSRQGSFDLIINATSAGHRGTDPVLVTGLFADDSLCYDLSYGPAHAALSGWCTAHKVRCIDGLGMLVEQAAESFRLWTGFTPQTNAVLAALRAEQFQARGNLPITSPASSNSG